MSEATAAASRRVGQVGADAIADALVTQGVNVIFTLCGSYLLPLHRALVDHGVRLVDTRSEGSAVFAADGYARATRRPGVALVTGGPGFTNWLTGLVRAHTAGSPVLLLSGAAELGRLGATCTRRSTRWRRPARWPRPW